MSRRATATHGRRTGITETTEELARRAIDGFDRHELAAEQLAELFTENAELSVAGVTFHGIEQIAIALTGFYTAFPDLRHEVLSAIGDGTDAVAVEHRIDGTHLGPFTTVAGTLGPTGKTVTWFSASVVRRSGGKISSWHIHQEQLGILDQLLDVSILTG